MKQPSPPRSILIRNTAAIVCFVIVFFWAVAHAEAREARPVRAVICDVFGSRCAAALRVARCESGLDPRAVSRTRDVGVFQVNFAAHRWPGESFAQFKRRLFDVEKNVRYAYRLSRDGTEWYRHWRWSAHCWQ